MPAAKANKLWYSSKSVRYLKRNDLLVYKFHYPDVQVYFLDHSATTTDVFGSQPKIVYQSPVTIPVYLKFEDFRKEIDRFSLQEVPDGMAIFSRAVLEECFGVHNVPVVEEDVLIKDFLDRDWRVTMAYRQDHIGNSDEFLHYACVLERMTRTNAYTPADLENENFRHLTGVGDPGLDICDILSFDHLTKEDLEEVQTYVLDNQVVYLAFPDSLNALTDIEDGQGNSVIGDFNLSTQTFEGVTYKVYELANPVTDNNFQVKWIP